MTSLLERPPRRYYGFGPTELIANSFYHHLKESQTYSKTTRVLQQYHARFATVVLLMSCECCKFQIVVFVAALVVTIDAGVLPAAYLANYASSYSASVVNHAVAAPVLAHAPLVASAPVVAAAHAAPLVAAAHPARVVAPAPVIAAATPPFGAYSVHPY